MGLHPHAPPNDTELQTIAELVQRHSGIVYQPRNYTSLVRAVTNRMAHLGVTHTHKYLMRLNNLEKPDELTKLTALLTVQKTSFFRDRSQFVLLEENALPDILSRSETVPANLKVWSAGCSTGEEPYSIAISLLRRWPYKNTTSILATDISAQALGKALLGSYRKLDLEPLQDQELTFFYREKDIWRVNERARSIIDFKFHNLVSVPFPVPSKGFWDIIFCRNVLIYFNQETIKEIIKRFHQVLSPQGYLFLGPSESLYRLVEGFDLVSTDNAFVYQKSSPETSSAAKMRPKRIGPTPKQPIENIPMVIQTPCKLDTSIGSTDIDLEQSLRLAKELLENNDIQAAFHRYLEISTAHPESKHPYIMLGKIAADRGSLEEALSWLQMASKIDPLDVEPRFLSAVLHHRLGRDQESADELKKVLFLNGNLIPGHYYLGVVADHLGDHDTALRCFRNVLKTIGTHADKSTCSIMNTLQLTLEMLESASRAHLKRLETKSARKRSNKR